MLNNIWRKAALLASLSLLYLHAMCSKLWRAATSLVGLSLLYLAVPAVAMAADPKHAPSISPHFDFPGLNWFTTSIGALLAALILVCFAIFCVSLVEVVMRVRGSHQHKGIGPPVIGALASAIVGVILLGGTLFFNKVIDYYA